MKLAQLVERKRSSGRGSIYSIQPYASVRETVRLLCEHRVGALLVVDDAQEVRGIVTERDVLNMIHSRSSSLEDVRVEEIMTRKVAIAQAEDTIQHALQVMSENNIRHCGFEHHRPSPRSIQPRRNLYPPHGRHVQR